MDEMRFAMKSGPLAVALMLWASLAVAGDTLSIRLVEASNPRKGREGAAAGERAAQGAPKGLEDIEDTLKQNLPFNTFALVDEQTMKLPASETANLARSFTVRCSGKQDALSVSLKRNKEELLSSVLSLRDNKPVILGGFPSDKGKLLVVLVAR